MSSEKNPTRARILKSTVELLEKGGGQKVRMSDIAKAAGISRQALYLHFPTRAELLVATTRYLDEVNDVDALLAESRAARGTARLAAWVAVWGNYIPKIYGVAKALMAMQETDEEAAAAWADRMGAVRHGCAAAVRALAEEGRLTGDMGEEEATDFLWALLSVRGWEQLRFECGWSQEDYVTRMQGAVARCLVVSPPLAATGARGHSAPSRSP